MLKLKKIRPLLFKDNDENSLIDENYEIYQNNAFSEDKNSDKESL